MPANIYIKRTAPQGPGRGQIAFEPGDWTHSGTWVATELPHEGEKIFPAAKSGSYSIANRIITMKGPDSTTLVVITDWGPGPLGNGPGQTFNPEDGTQMNIAWSLSVWPIDI